MSRQGRSIYRDPHGNEASSRQKVISNKSPSDTEYDVRSLSTRPDPSYYGRNFKNSEKGRSSSFAQGDRKEPKMPDPYVKRPQPYPPHVQNDYAAYKQHEGVLNDAKTRYGAFRPKQPQDIGKACSDRETKWKEGLPVAREARTAANLFAASRSGFDHKYPHAYDSVASRDNHREEARRNLATARNYANHERTIKRKLENENRSRGRR